MEQFKISSLISISLDFPTFGFLDFTLTNIGLYFSIFFITILSLNIFANNNGNLIPSKWEISSNSGFFSVHNLLISQIGYKGEVYLPFIYSLFVLILGLNLLGIVTFSFAVTAHICFMISLSTMILIGLTVIGYIGHGIKFFSFFLPGGTPTILIIPLVCIETLSYLARAISLGGRTAINNLSGHALLSVLATFLKKGLIGGGLLLFMASLIPMALFCAVFLLELGVATIQGFVFLILVVSYCGDAISIGHQ